FILFTFLYLLKFGFLDNFSNSVSTDYTQIEVGEINETYITEPIFGSMNYNEYIPGHLPLIISIPH
ncbi:15832_t:CDS:1, partial [Gigaspora margarita]